MAHIAQLQAGDILQFLLSGLAALLMLHFAHGLVQHAHALAQGAGEPVQAAQLVQHGPADAVFRVGLKADAQLRTKFAQSFHEAQSAGADHLAQFHAAGQLGFEPQSQKADLGRVVPHHLFLFRRGEILPGCGAGFKRFPGTYLLCLRCAGFHVVFLSGSCLFFLRHARMPRCVAAVLSPPGRTTE